MSSKKKTLVCIILLVVIAASALAVGIHQFVNRPEPIDRETYEGLLGDNFYEKVYLKNTKVICVDFEGNRYTFTVEDALEFDEYTRDMIDHMELETQYYSNVDSSNQEES